MRSRSSPSRVRRVVRSCVSWPPRLRSMVNPTIVELRRRYAARAQVEVERVLTSDLSSLDATQRAVLRRWAAGLSHHLAHVPSRGLRDLAASAGPEAAADFLEAAAPDLAKELRARLRV